MRCCIVLYYESVVVSVHYTVSVLSYHNALILTESNGGVQLLEGHISTLTSAGSVALGRSGWFDQETYFSAFIEGSSESYIKSSADANSPGSVGSWHAF